MIVRCRYGRTIAARLGLRPLSRDRVTRNERANPGTWRRHGRPDSGADSTARAVGRCGRRWRPRRRSGRRSWVLRWPTLYSIVAMTPGRFRRDTAHDRLPYCWWWSRCWCRVLSCRLTSLPWRAVDGGVGRFPGCRLSGSPGSVGSGRLRRSRDCVSAGSPVRSFAARMPLVRRRARR